jgi:glycosyltransferase involved in cell wall biosynthesis
MKILSVHNRYLLRGGEDESTELENALLRERGHRVFEYFADNHSIDGAHLVAVGIRSVWNPATYSNVRKLIQEHEIDLVKIDNFFPQISPSVYYAARAEHVPTVQSLRNFRLLCPGAIFFRDGKVCEDCISRPIPWPGVLHGCYRNSRTQTLGPATMASIHRLAGTWNRCVTAYVALSEFSRQKFLQGGLPGAKVFVKPNFVPDYGIGNGEDHCALFVGRLTPEKGIDVLLSAWERIRERLKLKIVGAGPLEAKVREHAATNPGIEYLGPKTLTETYDLMGRAMALIFPSQWYETFGRAVAESFAKGTPVIAAELGNMKLMVTHQRTGLHFEPGSADSLVEQVEWMLAHEVEWKQMRPAARLAYEESFTPARNYEIMMHIFERALGIKQEELDWRNRTVRA